MDKGIFELMEKLFLLTKAFTYQSGPAYIGRIINEYDYESHQSRMVWIVLWH